ncbi:MAG: c-type cytochrome domain-containing protein, partial [Planctomycetaceae bacterium]
MKRLLLCLLGVCFAALGGLGMPLVPSARAADPALPDRPSFEAHIRPLLKAHCWHCHGEAERVEGSLDLRQARRLLKGGDTGPGAVAGQPGESLLLERVES